MAGWTFQSFQKLRADWIRGLPAAVWSRHFCLPDCYRKYKSKNMHF